MSLKKLPIADATAAQLRDYAQTALGLPVHANMNKSTLIAELANVGVSDFILIADAPEVVPGQILRVNSGDVMSGAPDPNTEKAAYEMWLEEKVMVLISTDDRPGGKEPVEVGLNEKMILIPRGTPQPVARKHVLCIKEATGMHYDPNPDGNGMQPGRPVPLYNMQIMGMAA